MRSVAFNGIFFTSLCLYSEIVERFGGEKKKSLFPQAEHCVGKHGELTTRNSNGRVLPLNAGTWEPGAIPAVRFHLNSVYAWTAGPL